MFMSRLGVFMDNPTKAHFSLIGRSIMLQDGLCGQVQDTFHIGPDVSADIEHMILIIELELPERGYLYSAATGVNLSGQLFVPARGIGSQFLVLD